MSVDTAGEVSGCTASIRLGSRRSESRRRIVAPTARVAIRTCGVDEHACVAARRLVFITRGIALYAGQEGKLAVDHLEKLSKEKLCEY